MQCPGRRAPRLRPRARRRGTSATALAGRRGRPPEGTPPRNGRSPLEQPRVPRAIPGSALEQRRCKALEVRDPGVAERLDADVIGARLEVLLHTAQDRVLIAPGDDAVDGRVASAFVELVLAEAEPEEVVAIVR